MLLITTHFWKRIADGKEGEPDKQFSQIGTFFSDLILGSRHG